MDPTTVPRRESRNDVSVVIPVFNGEASLAELVSRIGGAIAPMGLEHEVILVNDGSGDRSWEVIEGLARENLRVRGLNLMRNYGQHNALLCGIRSARYPLTLTLDDDLQNPPEEMHRLFEALVPGVDVVYGSPAKERHTLWRALASSLTKAVLQGSMGVQTARNVSAFRLFRTRLRDSFADYRGSFVSIDVLLTWGSTRFSSIPVEHSPRKYGASNYTLRKLLFHAMNMVTGFSTLPLEAASMIGFAFTIFGVFVLAYVLVRFLVGGGSVPGFPFLASIISIFSGVQLFALGIIGEYLARMHFRMMDKPSYAVRGGTGAEADGTADA